MHVINLTIIFCGIIILSIWGTTTAQSLSSKYNVSYKRFGLFSLKFRQEDIKNKNDKQVNRLFKKLLIIKQALMLLQIIFVTYFVCLMFLNM